MKYAPKFHTPLKFTLKFVAHCQVTKHFYRQTDNGYGIDVGDHRVG